MNKKRTASLFSRFPKSRSPLPPAYREIYKKHYLENRAGLSRVTSISQRLETWMHHMVAQDASLHGNTCRTLEIGAGTLNHIPFELHAAIYDIIEPKQWLFEGSPLASRVKNVYRDIRSIPLRRKYDRIISIATFEHLEDLPFVVARSGLLLERNGTLRIAIPSEGTLTWRLAWMLTTGLEFRLRYGLSYKVIMRHEHVNTAREIYQVLRYFFHDIRGSVFGLIPELSFYQFFACGNPILNACRDYENEA